jgi:hypothetical protein
MAWGSQSRIMGTQGPKKRQLWEEQTHTWVMDALPAAGALGVDGAVIRLRTDGRVRLRQRRPPLRLDAAAGGAAAVRREQSSLHDGCRARSRRLQMSLHGKAIAIAMFCSSPKPIGYNWSYLACRIGHLVPYLAASNHPHCTSASCRTPSWPSPAMRPPEPCMAGNHEVDIHSSPLLHAHLP